MTQGKHITAGPLLRALAFVGIVALIALAPTLGLDSGMTRQVILIAVISLIVTGLNLSFGYAGEFAVGQAALFAVGAYVTGYLAVNHVNDILLLALVSGAAAMVVGLIIGIPSVRLGGWVLGIASFFMVLLVPDVLNLIGEPVGGLHGLAGIPEAAIFGIGLSAGGFYIAVVLIAALWLLLFRNLVVSPRGAQFKVLSQSAALTSSLGIAGTSVKLKAYTIGALPAGIAGCLFAYLDGFIAPEAFGLHMAIVILASAVLGGVRTVYGAVLGSALMQLGPLGTTAFERYALVSYGAFLLIGGVLLPQGLVPLLRTLFLRMRLRIKGQPAPAQGESAPVPVARSAFPPIPGQILRVEAAGKRFGGIIALQGISLTARPGQITALIGPNGSGKTTVLNVVSGFYIPDSGRIMLGDQEVTALPPNIRAHLGVGRTFQTPAIPRDMTVREAVRSGALMREPGIVATMLRLPSYFRANRAEEAAVDAALAATGLAGVAEEQASSQPLGIRRLIELARSLMMRPGVLLLDEIASGLDAEEIEELSAVILALREAGATILLVEHNFDLVAAVADHVIVMAEGALLAEGSAAEIEANEQVRLKYLGEGPPPVAALQEIAS
ncbi:MAG: ATP-binding cassette domain-containing protein [Paracoccus sp. (in: a-proteobacteria)]|uniref:branched-chain amino acid ABC transporter ATP-binding protein/permease n=1 Tax=Paracoccus sp. TaxID=267 RepID=UPI0039E34B38